MRDPDTFFMGFDSARGSRKEKAYDIFCLKMLNRHFREILDVDPRSIWEDNGVADKMAELRARTSHPILQVLHFSNEPVSLVEAYKSFPNSKIWKSAIEVLRESEKVVTAFQMVGLGPHVLHNLPQTSTTVARKPRIIWLGMAGNCLTLEHLDVFLEEYR